MESFCRFFNAFEEPFCTLVEKVSVQNVGSFDQNVGSFDRNAEFFDRNVGSLKNPEK